MRSVRGGGGVAAYGPNLVNDKIKKNPTGKRTVNSVFPKDAGSLLPDPTVSGPTGYSQPDIPGADQIFRIQAHAQHVQNQNYECANLCQ